MLDAPFPTIQRNLGIDGPAQGAVSKRDRECAETWLLHFLELHGVAAPQRISIAAEVIAGAASRGDPARFMLEVAGEARRALSGRSRYFGPPMRRRSMKPHALDYLSWDALGRGIFERLQGKERLELSFK
ncbi:MAG TPA: hypothetical protein VNO43_08415 [Candidatus Eisenbacteria bacterium]|nr:hypothetical protein [Candidatus Eisenbacteria bacterium]